ncbi:MAG: DUF2339 domain-containing protein [Lachnospiraceae bacterium]
MLDKLSADEKQVIRNGIHEQTLQQKINEYEQRLIEDRRKLLELSDEGSENEAEIIREKLFFFQTELDYLSRQYELLKCRAEKKIAESEPVREHEVQRETTKDYTSQPRAAYSRTVDYTASSYVTAPKTKADTSFQNQTVSMISGKEEKDKKDIEQTIGKSFMGVFASVLIFVSLILFSTQMDSRLGEVLKMILLYAVSLAFVAVGLYKLQKDKTNHFYIAITGCGIGAVYISLFLTNIYFQYIGDITLYILLAVWAVCVCVLSGYQGKIFGIIGQCGVTVAVVFGSRVCMESEDESKTVVLVIFALVASAIYYINSYRRERSAGLVHHVFSLINLFFLYTPCRFYGKEHSGEIQWLMIAMTIVILVHMGVVFFEKWKRGSFAYGLVINTYFIMMAVYLKAALSDEAAGWCYYVAAMALVLLTELKIKYWNTKCFDQDMVALGEKKNYHGKALVQLFMMIILWISGLLIELSEEIVFVLAICMPVAALGLCFGSRTLKYGAMVLFGMYAVFCTGSIEFTDIVLGIAFLAVCYWGMFLKKDQYTFAYKIWLYLITILYIITILSTWLYNMNWDSEIVSVVLYLIVLLYSLVMRKFCTTDLRTGEKEKIWFYDCANLVLMLYGLGLISELEGQLPHVIIILAALFPFLVNVKSIFDKWEGYIPGVYVGFKFTVFMVVVLSSFNAGNYVISVCCFLLAMASISTGFIFRYKSLRIYGIVLSMISIFKLLVVDISYENTMGKAAGFFISGILCFIISMIYNYVDKKLSAK